MATAVATKSAETAAYTDAWSALEAQVGALKGTHLRDLLQYVFLFFLRVSLLKSDSLLAWAFGRGVGIVRAARSLGSRLGECATRASVSVGVARREVFLGVRGYPMLWSFHGLITHALLLASMSCAAFSWPFVPFCTVCEHLLCVCLSSAVTEMTIVALPWLQPTPASRLTTPAKRPPRRRCFTCRSWPRRRGCRRRWLL